MSEFDQLPPRFSSAEVLERLRSDYGLVAALSPLVSERDQNFRVDVGDRRLVLKISNLAEDRAFLELQTAVLAHLEVTDPALGVPRVLPARNGSALMQWPGANGMHWVRLLSYLPGRLYSATAGSSATLASLGRFMGRLSRALKGFGHPAAHRPDFLWNLDEVLKLKPWIADIADEAHRAIAARLMARYQQRTAPRLPCLRAAVLHQDANDNNLLVDDQDQVCGLIDFGDLCFGRQINELAIALAYALLDQDDLQAAAQALIAAYAARFPLEVEEADALFDLVAMRLVGSVCISSRRSREFPDNDYLTISQAPALRLLARLDGSDPEELAALARSAAGLGVEVLDSAATGLPAPERLRADAQSIEALRQRRARVLGPSLSLSYRHPLKIVRGRGAWLYDHKVAPMSTASTTSATSATAIRMWCRRRRVRPRC
ncbi:MAG: phosphotransferase [Xanthomonadales bacterium]|nr:phosphotransferase [Xanthomonadales bacterium]